MEHQEGREQPYSITPHLQDPNPSLSDEFSASKDVNFRSSETTNAHKAYLQLLPTLPSPQALLLGSAYLGISPFDAAHSSQEVAEAAGVCYNNSMALRMDELDRNIYSSTNEMLNKYHLPLSTLPPEFLLLSSSRFAGKHSHSQVSMPFGDLGDLPANTQQAHWSYAADAYEISNPMRSLGIQGQPNFASGFNIDAGSSYSHYPLMSRKKRKIIWQDDNAHHRSSWYLSRVGNDQGHRYSMYDQKYETIGLHADPHLRMFTLTNRNKGNGGEANGN